MKTILLTLTIWSITLTPGPSPTLHWTAPGDDGTVGRAAEYDIRYSTELITENNWSMAGSVSGEPVPSVSGTPEQYTVEGLDPGTEYYFAIKAADEVPNWSLLSNVISYTTPYWCNGEPDLNCDEVLDISDLVFLIDYMFKGGLADCDNWDPMRADVDCSGQLDISDLMILIDYMFLQEPR